MASLTVVRTALCDTLTDNITGLRAYYTVPDVTNPPAVVPIPADADFTVAMGRGADTWAFNLYVLVPSASSRAGQNSLDAYLTGAGDSSIRACIFAHRTLGLADTDAHVRGMSSYGAQFEAAGIDHIGAVLHLTVHTTGTA